MKGYGDGKGMTSAALPSQRTATTTPSPAPHTCATNSPIQGMDGAILDSDVWPLGLMLAFALSNGWLTTTAFVRSATAVPPEDQGKASLLLQPTTILNEP